MFDYNRDVVARDNVLFGEHNPDDYHGGIRRFAEMDLEELRIMFAGRWIAPDEAQNFSPTAQQILEFMEEYPSYLTYGYAVSADRDDYRITLEGVFKRSGYTSEEELQDFTNLFRHADEFYAGRDGMYCWYD